MCLVTLQTVHNERFILGCGIDHLQIVRLWMFSTLCWKLQILLFYLVLRYQEILIQSFEIRGILFPTLTSLLLKHTFVLTQVVPHPTHVYLSGHSTLKDLVLLSAASQLVTCDVIPRAPLGNSDHNGVCIGLKLFWKPSPVKTPKHIIQRYSRADFDKANHLLDTIDTCRIFLDDRSDIATLWDICTAKAYLLKMTK